jgi:predicted acylesterase/phospholipase RssA
MDKESKTTATAAAPSPRKIKHIVLSGGGGTGFAYYGALRDSNKDGFWNIDDIQTMHGVSCGAIFLFIVAMTKHIPWKDFDDYLIKRPWETVFGFSPDRIIGAYSNVGICNREAIEMVLSPILRAADLPLNITMQQFYDFTSIEVHLYTTNLNTYTLVDISYKTHPEWELVDAIYSSCALPLLFRPPFINGEVYVDGGLLCNYPLQQCIEQVEHPDEIFGINKIGLVNGELVEDTEKTAEYANIVDYLLDIIAKTAKQLIFKPINSKYTLDIKDTVTSAWEVYGVVKTRESREAKIQYGADYWKTYKVQIGFPEKGTVLDPES